MKLALIGLKGHQAGIVGEARTTPGVEIVAVANDPVGKAEQFCASEPLAEKAQTYRDWRHLVEHTLMDACCVCDENSLRAEQIVALAERGVSIIAEKPLVTSLDDLTRVRQTLAKSKSRLIMLLTMRYDPKYATMHKLVREGAIGSICQMSAQKSYRLGERPEWFKHRDRLGGTIPYIGIHMIDLMQWIAGLDYTHVAAFHGNQARPQIKETEDQASVLLRLANGATATCRLDYLRPETASTHGDAKLRIVGSDGILEAGENEPELTLLSANGPPRTIKPESTPGMLAEFLALVRDGRPPRLTADDCLYATEVVLHARQAADTKQMIELPKRRQASS